MKKFRRIAKVSLVLAAVTAILAAASPANAYIIHPPKLGPSPSYIIHPPKL
jgi:hypothetical protein